MIRAFIHEREDRKEAIRGRTLQENPRCGNVAASAGKLALRPVSPAALSGR